MEETDLVARAKKGCPEAVAEIVERYQRPLFSFLYRYVGQAADAEDLCQEVFLRAFRKIGGFRSQSRLSTWLFTIATNQARNWGRKQRRRGHVETFWRDGLPDDCVAAAETDHTEAVETAESGQAVRTAVGSLPPRERAAVLLRTYHELRYEEIADVLECSTAAVGALLCRARKRLADKLGHLVE